MSGAAPPKHPYGVALALLAGFWAVTALILARWDPDPALARIFFVPGYGWRYADTVWAEGLRRFGTWPGMMLAAAALWILTKPRFGANLRRCALVVLLTAIIGPGLLVNVAFKDHWGRPRPRQTAAFGGLWEYRPFYEHGVPGRGKSFPSGHAAMGFLLLAPLACRPLSRKKVLVLTVTGLAYGGAVSAARMAQGAHFGTDCLGSLAFVTLTAFSLAALIGPVSGWLRRLRAAPPAARWIWRLAGAGCIAILLLVFLTARPFYESREVAVTPPAPGGGLRVLAVPPPDRLRGVSHHGRRAAAGDQRAWQRCFQPGCAHKRRGPAGRRQPGRHGPY